MLQGKHSAILLNYIKLPFVIKIFVLSNFEWPFYTGFTVDHTALKISKDLKNSLSLSLKFVLGDKRTP